MQKRGQETESQNQRDTERDRPGESRKNTGRVGGGMVVVDRIPRRNRDPEQVTIVRGGA